MRSTCTAIRTSRSSSSCAPRPLAPCDQAPAALVLTQRSQSSTPAILGRSLADAESNGTLESNRYVLQYFLCPLLLRPGFFATVLSNALYGCSFSYYHYTQFLGYSALPFLDRTEFFLYPIAGIALAIPLAVLSGFNPTRFVLGIYFS